MTACPHPPMIPSLQVWTTADIFYSQLIHIIHVSVWASRIRAARSRRNPVAASRKEAWLCCTMSILTTGYRISTGSEMMCGYKVNKRQALVVLIPCAILSGRTSVRQSRSGISRPGHWPREKKSVYWLAIPITAISDRLQTCGASLSS